jgi:hypothetical protein
MDVPTISIKIRGLQALEAMNGNGQIMGGVKIKGMKALMGLRELDGNRRALMAKKGMLMREVEMEGGRRMMMQPLTPPTPPMDTATAVKGAVAKTTSGASTLKGVAAKGAIVSGTGAGAAATAHGLGWGLGLGGLGPWLALAALGLAATGIYFYMRAQQLAQAANEDNGDLEPPV